jgi:hypothetical protein
MMRHMALAAIVAVAGGCGRSRSPIGAPATVASGVSSPTLARAADGSVIVAWIGGDGNVYVARRTPDGGFGEPVRANDVSGEAAPHEQAPSQTAVGPNGEVYVVWQTRVPIAGRRFPASDLRLARSTDGGGTFEPAHTVNDDAGATPTSHTFHDLYVAEDGTVYASWIDGRTTESARRDQPHHGGAHDQGPLGPEVRVARSADGGRTFSASVVVDRDACPCCRTSLARAPDGALYVAWRKIFAHDVRDVVVARSRDGGASFEAPVRVYADNWVYPGCPHAGPSLAVDDAGTVHVVWYTGAQGRAGLYLATSRDAGETFGEPVPLNDGVAPVSHARLAPADGGVWIAWEDRGASGGRVRLSRCGPDGKVRASGDLGDGRAPAVAGGPAGPAVAWLLGDTLRVAVAR